MSVVALVDLRDRPFELLQEFERRSRLAAAGRGREAGVDVQNEWVGVAFRIQDELMVARRDQVREILTYPGVTRIPGAKPWLLGLANVRGQLLPIIDLQVFFGGEPTVVGRQTRVLVVNHAEIPAGLLVDEVRGFRRFTADEEPEELLRLAPAKKPFISGGYRAGDDLWELMSLHDLVESPVFLQAAE